MRFVNTTSYQFQNVNDLELEELQGGYCILSHRWTWGDDEIHYADVVAIKPEIQKKGGFSKFKGACNLAKELGYDLIWIDTCCINKTDLAEVSEAINSMYRWYSMSKLCIVYLQDIFSIDVFGASDWFNRGWTLQELIAPNSLHFYDQHWRYMGDKRSLSGQIESRTKIPADVLINSKPPGAYSVAQRMSWAAKRKTGRVEDQAYSLMGLFDVNMPLIYGERERAFIRLQEQIITRSADESIFVWDLGMPRNTTRNVRNMFSGLLAPSPACFLNCGDIIPSGPSQGFSVTQFGLNISARATVDTLLVYRATLQVRRNKVDGNCALLLAKLPGANAYARVSDTAGESFVTVKNPPEKATWFTIPMQPKEPPFNLYHGFWLRELELHSPHIRDYHKLQRLYSEEDRFLMPVGQIGTAGVIWLRLCEGKNSLSSGWIKLGFDPECRPICMIECFPPGSINTGRRDEQAQEFLASTPRPECLRQYPYYDPSIVNHRVFSDSWLKAPNMGFRDWCRDTRIMEKEPDGGFKFSWVNPLFKMTVSAVLIPDLSPHRTKDQHVWAINIVVDEKPGPILTRRDNVCCC